jgi:hypothetical protein
LKDNNSAEKKQTFSPSWKSAERQQRRTINSSGCSLAASKPQKNLPTRTFCSLLNSNFVLPPQTYNNNNQHQQLSGDIDLRTWQQHPTSAQKQPSGDFDFLPWQQPLTCAPNTPNPWLVLTTITSKADKMAVAKVKARETTNLVTIKDHGNKMLGEYIDLSFYSTWAENAQCYSKTPKS